MTAAFLPKIHHPPHDPYSWVLDAGTGWRIGHAEGVEKSPAAGRLSLSPLPGSGRRLDEPGGSFGGLTLPVNAALNGCADLYLLDTVQQSIKRFDPCICRFGLLPCIGGEGGRPRQFRQARAIAAHCGQLYVCDAGNHRIQVFTLPDLSLRAIWRSPRQLAEPWRIVDLVFTNSGHALAADEANSAVHRLDREGDCLESFLGVGTPRALATDCQGNLYVLSEGGEGAAVLNPETGEILAHVARPDEIAARFPSLPLNIGENGVLQLTGLCRDAAEDVFFDLRGNPVEKPLSGSPSFYPKEGTYISQALDSGIYRCRWDRLKIHGAAPARTRVRVLTYTAETELPMELISSLPDDAWSTRQTAPSGSLDPAEESWDCLIRSDEGRFLWLKLVFLGNGDAAPQISRVTAWFPRISLRRYLPAVFGAEPISADFTDRFLALFDRTLRSVEDRIDRQAALFDPLSAPAGEGRGDFLGWLASWIGISLDRRWTLQKRRNYLKNAGKLFRYRGTLPGLRDQLYLYLGMHAEGHCRDDAGCGPCRTEAGPKWRPPPLILEHFKLRRWLFLDGGRLGDQARLWGERIVNRTRLGGEAADGQGRLGVTRLLTHQDPLRDPFHVYAHIFSVFVPYRCFRSPQARKGLERLLENERPAHTECRIVYVKPRFRIGVQSMIGFDSVIACYEEGHRLDEKTKLGRGTILTSETAGAGAQIGRTTRLQ
ncbi:MAG: phage tail protein [Gammaproteobacteria bacterium]